MLWLIKVTLKQATIIVLVQYSLQSLRSVGIVAEVKMMNLKRWLQLMGRLGIAPNEVTHQALLTAYSEKHRRYHTAAHINATLKHLDTVTDLANNACEIEIALWFHDAIYKPFSASNELDSAVWASTFLSDNGVAKERIDRVYNLIMATVHTAETAGNDQLLMVDIDLSILGTKSTVYDQFEKDVRYEYKPVPYFLYRKKRKEILTSFLERDRIYRYDFFHSKLEEQARVNLSNAIEVL
jgi:predicted metal-dependent HD superfamily phosphohydrolase